MQSAFYLSGVVSLRFLDFMDSFKGVLLNVFWSIEGLGGNEGLGGEQRLIRGGL